MKQSFKTWVSLEPRKGRQQRGVDLGALLSRAAILRSGIGSPLRPREVDERDSPVRHVSGAAGGAEAPNVQVEDSVRPRAYFVRCGLPRAPMAVAPLHDVHQPVEVLKRVLREAHDVHAAVAGLQSPHLVAPVE
eukprot:scaffold301_cov243-Pinguiococcus_pyrenoidosus.AAC.90